MARIAKVVWNDVAFLAIIGMFVVRTGRWSCAERIAVARAAKRNAIFVTTTTVAARQDRTFLAVCAVTNLAIFDGIIRVTEPYSMFAAVACIRPARVVEAFAHRTVATDFASGESNDE